MNTLAYILDKFNLETGKDMPVEIPNIGRNEFAGLLADLGFSLGVEVGVWKGEYAEILLRANPQLILYGVDPWDHRAFPPGIKGWTQDQRDYDGFYEQAVARLSKYPNHQILRRYSLDAVKDFVDNTLDFAYIDGNHNFQNCCNDIIEWQKKIRPGGILAGHDYAYFPKEADIHVKECVLGLTRAYDIRPWFILGETARKPGVIRDKYRTFFWVK